VLVLFRPIYVVRDAKEFGEKAWYFRIQSGCWVVNGVRRHPEVLFPP
jgi:hypothetical protein